MVIGEKNPNLCHVVSISLEFAGLLAPINPAIAETYTPPPTRAERDHFILYANFWYLIGGTAEKV